MHKNKKNTPKSLKKAKKLNLAKETGLLDLQKAPQPQQRFIPLMETAEDMAKALLEIGRVEENWHASWQDTDITAPAFIIEDTAFESMDFTLDVRLLGSNDYIIVFSNCEFKNEKSRLGGLPLNIVGNRKVVVFNKCKFYESNWEVHTPGHVIVDSCEAYGQSLYFESHGESTIVFRGENRTNAGICVKKYAKVIISDNLNGVSSGGVRIYEPTIVDVGRATYKTMTNRHHYAQSIHIFNMKATISEGEPKLHVSNSDLSQWSIRIIDSSLNSINVCAAATIGQLVIKDSRVGYYGVGYTSHVQMICAVDSLVKAFDDGDRTDYVFSSNSVGIPEKPMTLYKKVRVKNIFGEEESAIVTLEVPAKALKNHSLYGSKCRVSEAKVKDINWFRDEKKDKRVHYFWPFNWVRSIHDYKFHYRRGKVVKPKEPFDKSSEECSSGIHGFIDIEDAIEY